MFAWSLVFVVTAAFAAPPSGPVLPSAKTDIGVAWADVIAFLEGDEAAKKKLRQWAAREDAQRILEEIRSESAVAKAACIERTKSIHPCEESFKKTTAELESLERTAAAFMNGGTSARASAWALVVWRRSIQTKILRLAEKRWDRECQGTRAPASCGAMLAEWSEIDEISKDAIEYGRRFYGESTGTVDWKALKQRMKKYD